MSQSSAIVIGASGSIGNAFIRLLVERNNIETIYAFARTEVSFDSAKVQSRLIDIEDEESIRQAAELVAKKIQPDLIIVATGMLHSAEIGPEKSLRDLSAAKFQRLFTVNAVCPALIAKHFLPALPRDRRAVFAALSARVGSISDNRLGGWYAYRASKAALNMILKNAAIEINRRHKQAIVVGLHPGTVDSALSKPFQGSVAQDKLFTPEFSAQKLLQVIDKLTIEDTGKTFAWDGQVIPF